MTPVATTRMEAVSMQGDVSRASGPEADVVQPKYEIVYRGHMDLAEAWEGPGVDTASAKQPQVGAWQPGAGDYGISTSLA